MLTKQDRDAFWNVVRDCLIDLLREQPREAVIAVNEYRAQIDAEDSTYDVFYHSEPFDIACAIKGIDERKAEDLYFQLIEKYLDILKFRNW